MAVPKAYKRARGDVGPAVYTPTNDPRAILFSLQHRHGQLIPTEKEEATLQWDAPWNVNKPIESMFFKMEELYAQTL